MRSQPVAQLVPQVPQPPPEPGRTGRPVPMDLTVLMRRPINPMRSTGLAMLLDLTVLMRPVHLGSPIVRGHHLTLPATRGVGVLVLVM